LPFHRVVSATRLDTLLLVADEKSRRFQFALGLDMNGPTHVALGLLGTNQPMVCAAANPLRSPRGWFLHVGAKNVLFTYVEPLDRPASGLRLRLLETDGRSTRTSVAAFRPFKAAWISDFRGNRTDVLSIIDGRAELDLASYGWVQIEAEW
ncbi:MAG TPA: hypothetical protein VHE81_07630, partial [Lacipirellulaceae bacterium]|nr:hypothetical protein [Lacipirellulaceae bacterium]